MGDRLKSRSPSLFPALQAGRAGGGESEDGTRAGACVTEMPEAGLISLAFVP